VTERERDRDQGALSTQSYNDTRRTAMLVTVTAVCLSDGLSLLRSRDQVSGVSGSMKKLLRTKLQSEMNVRGRNVKLVIRATCSLRSKTPWARGQTLSFLNKYERV